MFSEAFLFREELVEEIKGRALQNIKRDGTE